MTMVRDEHARDRLCSTFPARNRLTCRNRTRSRRPAIAFQFVRLDAAGEPAGREILLADSTVFNTLFGADDSLKRFGTNLATAR